MAIRCFILPLVGLLFLCAPAAGQDVKPPDQPGKDAILPQQKDEPSKDVFKALLQKAQDEYRLYFKEPKNALEYWAAASYEIQVGKFDMAAFHIDKLLQLPQKEADSDLVKIEGAEGLNAFLRLRTVREWSKDKAIEVAARKNAETLIDRVIAALDAHLSDRERLAYFVEGLSDKVPEVRAFSLYQLERAKHRAGAALVDALRNAEPEKRDIIKNAMAALGPDIVPPLLEMFVARDAKDAADAQLRLDFLWVAKARMDHRFVPYLWHLSNAPPYPKIVRDQAKQTLAYILGTGVERLPDAKIALTKLAEDYYQHKVRWPDITEVADRDDPTKQIPIAAYKRWYRNESGGINAAPDTLRPDDARLALGLRFARQALDLDPAYIPAQSVFLALLLEAELTRKPFDGQLDKLLFDEAAPSLQQLLAKIDSDLIKVVLERALQEQNYSVMLPLINAVGKRGDTRLVQPASGGTPGLLVRLLHFPDRRVQYAAARAMLSLPVTQAPIASSRIVDVLRRFLAADSAPKVLIAFTREQDAAELRQAATEAGFEAAFAGSIKQAFELLHGSADFDAILLGDAMNRSEFPFVLSELRADQDAGNLPLLLIASPERRADLSILAARTRNTFVLPSAWAFKGSELKRQLEDAIKFAAASTVLRTAPDDQQQWLQYEVRRAKGQALSDAEKKRMARDALDWFAQMARGELPGYDLAPAKNALLKAIENEDMAAQALRVLARVPTAEVQYRLAQVILDAKKANVHVIAAQELGRHIRKNGLALNANQITLLQQMEQQAELPAPLRVELANVVGAVRSTQRMTGLNMLGYIPGPPPEEKK